MGYFAQTNYSQKQGINGKYTIAQIGCLITAFGNMLARLNNSAGMDPASINNILIARNAYIDVDDGIRDDVGWGTITNIDPSVVVTGSGAGVPPHSQAIVKFIYSGGKTHFALVYDAGRGLIIDSWDGVIKSWNVYGGPKAYATYNKVKAQVPSVNSGDIDMIHDTDAEFWRADLLLQSVRGRKFTSRDEFRKYVVGKTWLGFIELALDADEAKNNSKVLELGKRAANENWEGQLNELKGQSAKDEETGRSFFRWIGNFWRKDQ